MAIALRSVFYCEFSANRAPKMLRHLRNLDRWIHAERYPELFYPELYLIDGGYKNCFETLKGAICDPAAVSADESSELRGSVQARLCDAAQSVATAQDVQQRRTIPATASPSEREQQQG
ncbi:hypothetical protein PINS_up016320 [Pythium insidiosum]|nr:hypothetical protein PINS_up016320 [Pythium insidiosum]